MEFMAAPVSVPLPYRIQDALHNARSEFDPWIASAAASFETKLPIPPSCDMFNSEGFFRLKSHQRSICFAPKSSEPIRNVFCIKGMEPLAPDFRSKLNAMASFRGDRDILNAVEHLILIEDKLPSCLLFNEARAEAVIAGSVQARLSKDCEGLPRLPLPVVCVRLPETIAETAVREIAACASRSLWPKIEMLAATGLGAYVYWYPSLPLRAEHFVADKKLAITIADRWISLAARLLRAGFLPTSALSFGRGQCCEPQNSVVDGGFADLDSVVPIADLPSRQDVFTALEMTIWSITATILHVLGGKRSAVARFDYVSNMVLHIVRERLTRACSNGADPAIMQFFGATETLGAVAQFLDRG